LWGDSEKYNKKYSGLGNGAKDMGIRGCCDFFLTVKDLAHFPLGDGKLSDDHHFENPKIDIKAIKKKAHL